MSSTQEANSERHYIVLTIAIFIGIIGVYLRFFDSASYVGVLSNIILIIAVVLGLRTVFAIMK